MIKSYFKSMKQDLIRFWNFILVKHAKRKAFKLHKKHNCEVFVVKFKGKILILSKYQFKQMRQHKMFPHSFTAEQLKKIALYCTPKQYRK